MNVQAVQPSYQSSGCPSLGPSACPRLGPTYCMLEYHYYCKNLDCLVYFMKKKPIHLKCNFQLSYCQNDPTLHVHYNTEQKWEQSTAICFTWSLSTSLSSSMRRAKMKLTLPYLLKSFSVASSSSPWPRRSKWRSSMSRHMIFSNSCTHLKINQNFIKKVYFVASRWNFFAWILIILPPASTDKN